MWLLLIVPALPAHTPCCSLCTLPKGSLRPGARPAFPTPRVRAVLPMPPVTFLAFCNWGRLTRVRAQLPSLSQLQAERIPSPRVGNSGSITLPHCSRPLALQAEAHSMLKLRPLPQTQAPLLRCVQEQLHAPRQVLNSPPP